MKIFMAGCKVCPYMVQNTLYRLDTFHDINPNKPSPQDNYKDYLLDSGAFSFLNAHNKGQSKSLDWLKYVDVYGEYVRRNNIRNFFELDIDNLIGYDNVLKLRARLENIVGRKCIPVWHLNRGKEEFKKMVREYPYVALGGFAMKKNATTHHAYFRILIDEAHRNNCRIHGLGFTNTRLLPQFPFDSVDSTSWLGSRWGILWRFTGTSMEQIQGSKMNKRMILTPSDCNNRNAREWLKYQRYAEVYL